MPDRKQVPDGRIDPDVKMPAAVQRAAARANEAFRQANPQPEPKAEDKPGSEAIGEPVAANPPAKTGATQVQDVPSLPTNPEPQRTAATNPAPRQNENPATPANQPPPQNLTPAEWEHKYRSLEGRMRYADGTIRELSDTVTNLQNVIASLQMHSAPPANNPPGNNAPPANPDTKLKLISDKEREEYGEEFLDVVERKAKELYQPVIDSLRHELGTIKQTVGAQVTLATNSAKDRMFAHMDEQVPNWKQINNDQDFIRWLALPDTYSGAIRHNLLKDAFAANDGRRVAAFFKGYLTETGAAPVPPAPINGAGPQAAPQGAAHKVDLASLAAPGRARSVAETPTEKPIITPAQIQQFYSDAARGKYEGREDERKRLERMIFEAQQEGRIRV